MEVLALLFVLTLAGKIQHSHSQEDKELEQLEWVLQLPQLNMLALMIMEDGFSSIDVNSNEEQEFKKSLDSASDNVLACLEELHTPGKQTCSLIKKVNECLKSVAGAGQKLLPDNAKYVAKLYIENQLKLLVLEYACNAKAADISELSSDCIMEKLPYEYFNEEYYQKHKEEPLKTFKATLTKANLCKAMRHFTPMYTDPVKETCKNNATVKAYNGYIEASFKDYCD